MSDLLDFSPPGQVTFSLAGAKARFFDAGTTTPRTVYADEAGTIPHPSPLLADSNGRFAQAFVSGGAVKVVVTQADDSTGYTLDPCIKVAATGSAANSISFTPSVLRPQTNVQDAIDSGTFPARTITGAGFITVSNGNGAGGNPTISYSPGAPITKTADFTVAATETFLINNKSGSACVVTLPAAASFTGRELTFQNLQAQAVNSAASNVIPLIGGAAAAAILPAVIGSWARLVSNGTSWQIVAESRNINLGVSVATTSGTSIDITGIPASARRVTVMVNRVSTNSISPLVVRLGTSGGIEATGYVGGAGYGGAANTLQNITTGFPISVEANTAAGSSLSGAVTFHSFGSNTWVASGTMHETLNQIGNFVSGDKTLSGVLDRIRLTTVGGTATFDAGSINICWE